MAFIDTLKTFLSKEGFCPETTEFGLQFKYQMLDFVHFRDDQDELFLNLFFPQIFVDITEENRQDVLLAINRANEETKVAKGGIRFNNGVWAGVEMLLSDNYDLGDIVPRTLNMLIYYRDVFYRALSETPSGEALMKQQSSEEK